MSNAFIAGIIESGEARHVGAEAIDALAGTPDLSLLVLTGDADKDPEAADVAVVARELVRQAGGRLTLLFAERRAEKTLMARFAVPVLPAIVALRGAEPCLVIPRIKAWGYYVAKIGDLLDRGEIAA